MTALTNAVLEAPAAAVPKSHLPKIAGVLFAAIVPALFWVAMIALIANVFGLTVTPMVLALTGSAISLFLAAVCAPLMLRAH
jgi:ABC-type Fe3+-siderophore transport system permease subunit